MIVVLDACVLYPPSLRDLLLTLGALDAFEIRWSEEILAEVTRNVVDDHPDIDQDRFVAHTIGAMRRAFPNASVAAAAELVATMDNHPKDRHVAAAAVEAAADAVVTTNTRDFGGRRLTEAGVEVLTPGVLVSRLLAGAPEVVVAAVDQLASRWVNPARTVQEIIALLAVHPTMGEPMAELRSHVEQP